jgi:predicted nucleic acid-binding protein
MWSVCARRRPVWGNATAKSEPRSRKGTSIGGNDHRIAAHALAIGFTLVTNNHREFKRVPALKIENRATS